eukprot:SAG31_NODE_33_length_32018_cov_69.763088_1_plen_719_part_00
MMANPVDDKVRLDEALRLLRAASVQAPEIALTGAPLNLRSQRLFEGLIGLRALLCLCADWGCSALAMPQAFQVDISFAGVVRATERGLPFAAPSPAVELGGCSSPSAAMTRAAPRSPSSPLAVSPSQHREYCRYCKKSFTSTATFEAHLRSKKHRQAEAAAAAASIRTNAGSPRGMTTGEGGQPAASIRTNAGSPAAAAQKPPEPTLSKDVVKADKYLADADKIAVASPNKATRLRYEAARRYLGAGALRAAIQAAAAAAGPLPIWREWKREQRGERRGCGEADQKRERVRAQIVDSIREIFTNLPDLLELHRDDSSDSSVELREPTPLEWQWIRVSNKHVRNGVGIAWVSKVLVARTLWHGSGAAVAATVTGAAGAPPYLSQAQKQAGAVAARWFVAVLDELFGGVANATFCGTWRAEAAAAQTKMTPDFSWCKNRATGLAKLLAEAVMLENTPHEGMLGPFQKINVLRACVTILLESAICIAACGWAACGESDIDIVATNRTSLLAAYMVTATATNLSAVQNQQDSCELTRQCDTDLAALANAVQWRLATSFQWEGDARAYGVGENARTWSGRCPAAVGESINILLRRVKLLDSAPARNAATAMAAALLVDDVVRAVRALDIVVQLCPTTAEQLPPRVPVEALDLTSPAESLLCWVVRLLHARLELDDDMGSWLNCVEQALRVDEQAAQDGELVNVCILLLRSVRSAIRNAAGALI